MSMLSYTKVNLDLPHIMLWAKSISPAQIVRLISAFSEYLSSCIQLSPDEHATKHNNSNMYTNPLRINIASFRF